MWTLILVIAAVALLDVFIVALVHGGDDDR